ncbi:MAG: nicotinate-nicotinamide nucleotide adenylyltransferase [Deltaproteobacteria bacterium]|nr:MAG: nicotinate-nicotinamide nucleotide adenylyltransferase [Deltaproteobacteria bacterium]
MRVGFYGGSFNPPHFSHFLAASWALCSGEVDEVWMVPCYQHAFGKILAPYEDRIKMCEIGASGLGPHIKVSDCERHIQSSYTVDVLETLCQKFPTHRFRLMVGSDIAEETKEWKSFELLAELAPPLWIPRGGYHSDSLGFSLPEVSSSAIRSRLQQGLSVEGALPNTIVSYIEEKQLYRTPC